MKRIKKDKSRKSKGGFGSKNRVVFAALAGALTGLAVTYLLETEKGRSILSQVGSTVKSFAGKLKMPALFRA